jgi:renalase
VPCLSAIAVYPELEDLGGLRGVTCLDDEMLGWIGFDSTKQIDPKQRTMIIQSNAKFAAMAFDSEDLNQVAQQLCDRASSVLNMPWIAKPELLQLHRWKYAFAINPIESQFLRATTAAPLYCIGDWCGGDRVESAFLSGLAIVEVL